MPSHASDSLAGQLGRTRPPQLSDVSEAWVTVTLDDGTRRTELWRRPTTLLDAERHPAVALIELYHRRWQAETCYFWLKSTVLAGRVLHLTDGSPALSRKSMPC